MRIRIRDALSGFSLGLGAPIGCLIWRVTTSPDSVRAAFMNEWRSASFYYVYMTIGTTTAFGLYGWLLGRNNERLKELSIHDGLTGLYNHRYLQEQLALEIDRSDRYASVLTCLMLDIDDFKTVNDTYGHPVGDTLLSAVAKAIGSTIRKTDILGRYGGEEFLVIMPHTIGAEAQLIANRTLDAIRQLSFSADNKTFGVTLSIGMATYPSPNIGIRTKNALLSAADQALYRAKRLGKNRLIAWDNVAS